MTAKALFALAAAACAAMADPEHTMPASEEALPHVGEPLPAWREGELDIHFINSGRGECTFFILPDGTTLVVDCGEIPDNPASRWPQVDRKPLSGESAHEVNARYIRHFHPGGPEARLDYMLVTHFHIDHMGESAATGVVAFYDLLPFDRLIDRGYPDYAKAVSLATRVGKINAYTAFVTDKVEKDGLRAERFELGRTDQIALLHDPGRYPDFQIVNYARDGKIWQGGKEVDLYGGNKVAENGASCGFLLRYGDFSFLTCGDAGANSKVEIPLAREIGHEIVAMKAYHHFSWNTHAPETMKILRPQVIVGQNFMAHQPWIPVLEGIWKASPRTRIYSTNMSPVNYQKEDVARAKEDHGGSGITDERYAAARGRMAAHNGHVVIRVEAGGKRYSVFVLADKDFSYRVLQIDGSIIERSWEPDAKRGPGSLTPEGL